LANGTSPAESENLECAGRAQPDEATQGEVVAERAPKPRIRVAWASKPSKSGRYVSHLGQYKARSGEIALSFIASSRV